MIEYIQLYRFQRWQYIRVDFDPLVTSIVGPSDRGKSAILRAIEWIATNRPLDTSMIKHGEESCRVKLCVDGQTIGRFKGTENVYRLGDKVYRAFSTDVPPDITKLLNLTEVNFQGQHDTPYWLKDTPGQVSRNLNAIVDLGSIDSVLTSLTSRVRKASAEYDVARQRRKTAKAEAAKLSRAEEIEKAFDRLVMLDETRRATARHVHYVRGRCQMATQAQTKVDNATRKLQAAQNLWALANKAYGATNQLNLLKEHVAEAGKLREMVVRPIPDMHRLTQLADDAASKGSKLRSYRDLLAGIAGFVTRIQIADEEISRLQQEIDKVKVCPLCGNPMPGPSRST